MLDVPSQAGLRRVQSNSQSGFANQILRTLMFAGGAGAAARGAVGLGRLFTPPAKPVDNQTIDMPIDYPAKHAADKPIYERFFNGSTDDTATSSVGLTNYIPSMILGSTLAAYGGWKGVDAIMDRQRQKRTDDELARAKQDYESSLLGSYKRASADSIENDLDQAFDAYEKHAAEDTMLGSAWNSAKDTFTNTFPNVPGATKGLALTYALTAGPLGYGIVNDRMQKNSKRALLQKAMRERARRRAQTQPAELYAIPSPHEQEEEAA